MTAAGPMRRDLTAVITREGEGYVAWCPALDIASQGETVETARARRWRCFSRRRRRPSLPKGRAKSECVVEGEAHKIAKILAEDESWEQDIDPVKCCLDQVELFRDAIVCPSPFTHAEKFGNYDKLAYLYSVDCHKAEEAAQTTCRLISTIHTFIRNDEAEPQWLKELQRSVDTSKQYRV